MLALQKALDVTTNRLPLYCDILSFSQVFSGENVIATGVLGNKHTGIGHADDVLDLEAMHGEAADAEAAGDLVLIQHGIVCAPQAQALGENLPLTPAGFWHQDDEFITAVAG